MSNDIIMYSLKKILNTKTIMFVNLYLFFGSFVFSNGNVGQSYTYIFAKCLTSQNFLLIFVFPPLLLLIIRSFNFFYSNYFLILRCGEKRKLGNYLLINCIAITSYYFISSMLCIGISANIVEHTSIIGYQLGYSSSDIFVLIVYIFKYYLYLLLISMISLILILKLKNIKMVICLMFIIILYFSLGSSVLFGNKIFNISRYIYQIGFTKLIYKDIIESSIFYISVHTIFLLTYFNLTKKIKVVAGLDVV